jgi:cytosine/adenosine deaminase-related metal-dependent hydrolase
MPGGAAAYADAQVAAAETAGMRLHLVRACMTSMEAGLEGELSQLLGPRAGGLVDEPKAVLADMGRVLAAHHGSGWGARCTVALGSTAVPYDDLPFMRRMAALAHEAGAGLHVHFHPRPDERATAQALHGSTPLDVLESMHWLRPGTWFAHSTRLTGDEMKRSASAGVAVAHCPRMILRLGARVTPVHEMLAAGMAVGFGVDGGASNDSGSMLGELRLGLLMHRLAGGEGTVPWQDWLSPYQALCMATRDAAAILRRDDIGRIEAGACADIVGFDLGGIGFAGARTDWLSGLLLAGDDTRAALTMVGGGLRVLGGKLLWADEQRLGGRVDAVTERLIASAAGLTGRDYAKAVGR